MPIPSPQPAAQPDTSLARSRPRARDAGGYRFGQLRRSMVGTGITIALVLLVVVVPAHVG